MATFANLKLSAAMKPTDMPAMQVRRNKLVKRLWEQVELAKGQQAGTQLTPTKFRTVVEHDTGIRKQVKQWWFTSHSGKLALNVPCGAC